MASAGVQPVAGIRWLARSLQRSPLPRALLRPVARALYLTAPTAPCSCLLSRSFNRNSEGERHFVKLGSRPVDSSSTLDLVVYC